MSKWISGFCWNVFFFSSVRFQEKSILLNAYDGQQSDVSIQVFWRVCFLSSYQLAFTYKLLLWTIWLKRARLSFVLYLDCQWFAIWLLTWPSSTHSTKRFGRIWLMTTSHLQERICNHLKSAKSLMDCTNVFYAPVVQHLAHHFGGTRTNSSALPVCYMLTGSLSIVVIPQPMNV